MKIIFSRQFQADLLKEETKYREISDAWQVLSASELPAKRAKSYDGKAAITSDRMASLVGAPNRFPFTSYYQVEGDSLYFLGLVHERRHPDFLKRRTQGRENI